ncbi:MAG: peptidylprolyl isomerase [Pseudomonadota bacterium]
MKRFARNPVFKVATVLALALLIILPARLSGPASAQDTLRAAAVVNDEVISMLDLIMRTRLVVLASGLERTPEAEQRMRGQVLRSLIDERLQLQEATRLDIKLDPQQLDGALEQIAQQNNMTRQQFEQVLVRQQILPQTLRDQINGSLTWRSVLAIRLRPTIEISDEEVDEVIGRIKQNHGATQLRLSEIFLPVDSPDQEDVVRETGVRMMEQLGAGADFNALARQFSSSATASVGGDLGWIQAEQLPDELIEVVNQMSESQVSGPVRTFGGFYILFLRGTRQVSMGAATLDLKQLLFDYPASAGESEIAAVRGQAAQAAGQVAGCENFDALAQEIGGPGSGDVGKLKLTDLPEATQGAVANLAVGQASQPVEIPGGFAVLVVCDRVDDGVDREQIRESLANQRLDIQARRYMRDLRRAANVDIRS